MRTIRKIHKAEYRPIADLKTWSPLPTRSLDMIDPFLFLNHHGPQVYKAGNRGLPFGPHPHRGMQTVTFILDGDIMHKDSGGHESVITAGGVQWMVAGRGLIHAEISSDNFKRTGGNLEIMQLWLNLPARLKMAEPFYLGLQKENIPTITLQDGKASLDLVSGQWEDTKGAFQPETDVFLSTVSLRDGAEVTFTVPESHNIFFYIIRGHLRVNGQSVKELELVEFNNDAQQLHLVAESNSLVLFGHAQPFNEPVVAQGPFVMNTEAEIAQAYQDYQQGKFGAWKG
jgi:redox-sensitive bicupin YhaK (pirin superfamily)